MAWSGSRPISSSGWQRDPGAFPPSSPWGPPGGSWVPTVVTALVQRLNLPEFFLAIVGGVESFLLVIFAVTVENGFVQMLPLPGTVGQALRRWNRWAWFAGLAAVLFLFFHLLMNPRGSLASALRVANVRF